MIVCILLERSFVSSAESAAAVRRTGAARGAWWARRDAGCTQRTRTVSTWKRSGSVLPRQR